MKNYKYSSGFILLELIIAMAVMSVIAVILYERNSNQYNIQEANIIGNEIANYAVSWAKEEKVVCDKKRYSILEKLICECNPEQPDYLKISLEIFQNKKSYYLAKTIENRIRERIYKKIKVGDDDNIIELNMKDMSKEKLSTMEKFIFRFTKGEYKQSQEEKDSEDELAKPIEKNKNNFEKNGYKCEISNVHIVSNQNFKCCSNFPLISVRGRATDIKQIIYTPGGEIQRIAMEDGGSYSANEQYIWKPKANQSFTLNEKHQKYKNNLQALICAKSVSSIILASDRSF